MHSEPSINDQPMTKKGTPGKLKKDGTPSLAGRWKRGTSTKKSINKKSAGKKKKPSTNKKNEDKGGLFLYWKNKKDDMFQKVGYPESEADVQELFIQNPKVEEIYLMQPVKLYNRPTLLVTDL